MFGGFSDSSLGSWSFGLQFLGVAGAFAVLISLLGLHFIGTESASRATRKGTDALSPLVLAPPDPVVTLPAARPPPKVEIALSKPVRREITEEQRSTFISELANSPKRPLEVVTYETNPEIAAYADQIRVMLVLAGFDCGSAVKTSSSISFTPVGLYIVVKDPARAPSYTGGLQTAFKAIGIDALGAKDDNFGPNQAAIVVGRQP